MGQIRQYTVSDKIGRQEVFEDAGAAFMRACQLARGDRAVNIDISDGPALVIIARDLRHTIHIVSTA